MKKNILFMLQLISSALTGSRPPQSDDGISWELIYEISKNHSITNLIAYPIADNSYNMSDELKDKFTKKLFERVFVTENQNAEIDRLVTAFEANDISYMPLKGLVLQNLYPSCDMRSMVDADILIKCEEYGKIAEIMQNLGYSFAGESDHEYNFFKKPFIHIELHKHLIPSYNEDMYAYFGNGWRSAKKCDGFCGRYELSTEDNFIYVLSHFAKHYRDGGIGIKHVIDIHLLCEKYTNMDKDYLEQNLLKLNLYEFYRNVLHLIDAWFRGGEFDETVCDMTAYIVNSGNFGSIKNSMSASAIRENKTLDDAAKFKYIKSVFPAPAKMKKIFPVLNKAPYLMPVMWLWRVVRLVLFRKEKISTLKNNAAMIKNDSVHKFNEHIKSVGLDIYNGRRKS